MNVYLSHINDEAEVASVLSQWIESSLDRDVRMSGEADTIGKQRLTAVNRSLGQAQVVLLLCSPRSLELPWIHFESGCAWFKGVPVLVVCHSGCSPADLDPPLSSFQAYELSDADSCQALLTALAAHLKRKRIPRIDYDLMVGELRAATDPDYVHEPSAAGDYDDDLDDEYDDDAPDESPQSLEIRLLAMIGEMPDFSATIRGLAAGLGAQERGLQFTLEKLVRDNLVALKASTVPTDPETRYAITERGRTHLARHDR